MSRLRRPILFCLTAMLAVAGFRCDSSTSTGTEGGGSGSSGSPVTTAGDRNEPEPVELDGMAGLVVADDHAVLADNTVPTGFWTAPIGSSDALGRLPEPRNPLWAKAITAERDNVLVLGARCDSMPHSEPEVVCTPGTDELWKLNRDEASWTRVAEIGSQRVSGAKFLDATPTSVSILLFRHPTPRSTKVRVVDVALSTGEVADIALPDDVTNPPDGWDVTVCGDGDHLTAAVAATESSTEASGAKLTGWSKSVEGQWVRAPEPSVPEGRWARIGCAGATVVAIVSTNASDSQSLVLDPASDAWETAPTPAWADPAATQTEPLLPVGNSDGRSLWQGTSLFTYEPKTASWDVTDFEVAGTVTAAATHEDGVVVTLAADDAGKIALDYLQR